VASVVACDIDPHCQEHIKRMQEAQYLMADVQEVAAGQGTDLITGKPVKIGQCDVLAAGTSCVNLSSMYLGQ